MPRKKTAVQNVSALGVSRAALALVEVVGLGIAVYLALIAFHVIYGGEVPCPRSKLFACESIVRGMFSKIGPVSIALLGVLYFVFQLGLTALLKRGRWAVAAKVLAVFAGLFFIAWLRSLELVYMKKICPWCWGVALTVLAQAAISWPLAVPPFPRLRLTGRIAMAFLLFFAFLGVTTATELLFRPSAGGTVRFFGHKPADSDMVAVEVDEKPALEAGASEKPATTAPQEAKPTPKPTPTPQATKAAVSPSASPTLAKSPAPTPRPVPVADEPEPPMDLMDIPELVMLQQRGWRMVATTERVEQLIQTRGPVLLMVYDPFCEECHATMRRGLNSDAVDRLPVTRVAIEQSSLTGPLSAQVTHVPTLLLIDPQGQVHWRHEARIEAAKLVEEITARVQQQGQERPL